MKPIERHRLFDRSYKKRIASNEKLKAQFIERLELFIRGERNYPLNDHALGGLLKGKRAFSVANDIRVIYLECEDKIVLIDIGTHAQVYK